MSLYSKASVLFLLVLVSVLPTDATNNVQPYNNGNQQNGIYPRGPYGYGYGSNPYNYQQRGYMNNNQQQMIQQRQWEQQENWNHNSGASSGQEQAIAQTLMSSSAQTSVTLGVTFLAMVPSTVKSFFS
jgi:hypothetical protein